MTYAELAAIDPRLGRLREVGDEYGDPVGSREVCEAVLIAASDALRQHATALEIGRGIGREEAAKVCDQRAEVLGSSGLRSRAFAMSEIAAAIRSGVEK